WPLLKRGRADVQGALRAMEEAERQVRAGGGEVLAAASPSPRSLKGFWAWLPLLWVVLSMTLSRVAVGWWPDLGLALTFAIGTGLIRLISQGPDWVGALRAAARQALPVLGVRVGGGAVSQVVALGGGRGWMVVSLLSPPARLLDLAAALGI